MCCLCGGGGVPPCSETSHSLVRTAPRQSVCEVQQQCVTGVCVFSALYWFNYELVKTQLCQWSQLTQANFSISFTAGAFSGGVSSQMLASRFRGLAIGVTPRTLSLQVAAVLTLPFDVVKTRRQIQLGEMDSLGGLTTILHAPTWAHKVS